MNTTEIENRSSKLEVYKKELAELRKYKDSILDGENYENVGIRKQKKIDHLSDEFSCYIRAIREMEAAN